MEGEYHMPSHESTTENVPSEATQCISTNSGSVLQRTVILEIIESILTSFRASLRASWYPTALCGSSSSQSKKLLQKVICVVEKVIGCLLTTLNKLFTTRVGTRGHKIANDPIHPMGNYLFRKQVLPKHMHQESFFMCAINLINQDQWCFSGFWTHMYQAYVCYWKPQSRMLLNKKTLATSKDMNYTQKTCIMQMRSQENWIKLFCNLSYKFPHKNTGITFGFKSQNLNTASPQYLPSRFYNSIP